MGRVYSPLLQGPDEDQHVAYVQAVAETGGGPSRDGGRGTYSTALAQTISGLGLAPTPQHTGARPYWDLAPRQQHNVTKLPRSAWANGTGPQRSCAESAAVLLDGRGRHITFRPSRSLLGRIFAIRLMTVGILCRNGRFDVDARDRAIRFYCGTAAPATGVVAFQPEACCYGGGRQSRCAPLSPARQVSYGWQSEPFVRGATSRRMLLMSSFAGAWSVSCMVADCSCSARLPSVSSWSLCGTGHALWPAARPIALSLVAVIPFVVIAAQWYLRRQRWRCVRRRGRATDDERWRKRPAVLVVCISVLGLRSIRVSPPARSAYGIPAGLYRYLLRRLRIPGGCALRNPLAR